MTGWHEGYVSDIPYSLGFYREMTPAHVAFCAAAVGKSAGGAVAPQRVLELGFGMGLGFVLGAAANPGTHFEGCDFNPEHALHARELATAAGLTNVTISDASFQDIARAAKEGQADLDMIVLHGILSWISADARAAIVEIARKRLKPGGLLYVSYNCYPGWAQLAPLQRMMRDVAKRTGANSAANMDAALALFKELTDEGARFFTTNNLIAPRLEKMQTMARSYLAHEYLNADWTVFHFADVASMFGDAKLSFVASATIAENIDAVSVPEAMRQRVASTQDPIWKETLRDYAMSKQFRRDIYARGSIPTTPAETNILLDSFRFMLCVPRDKVTFKIQAGLGEMNGNPELYGALADLLSIKATTVAEIASLPVFAPSGRQGALQAIALMVHTGQAMPIAPGHKADPKPAQRFNRVMAERMLRARANNFLATPVTGSGIGASNTELLMLGALHRGAREQAGPLLDATIQAMAQIGVKPVREGKAVTDDAEIRSVMTADVEAFLSQTLPVWKKLGVV